MRRIRTGNNRRKAKALKQILKGREIVGFYELLVTGVSDNQIYCCARSTIPSGETLEEWGCVPRRYFKPYFVCQDQKFEMTVSNNSRIIIKPRGIKPDDIQGSGDELAELLSRYPNHFIYQENYN